MKPPREPDLELRGKLIRSLGSLREMLPGSFVERKRACGRPNCHCADGKNLHSQFQISVLVDGKPKALNIPAQLVRALVSTPPGAKFFQPKTNILTHGAGLLGH